MSKWLDEALEHEPVAKKHLKMIGDKPFPPGLDIPHNARNERKATDFADKFVHMRGPKHD